METKHTPGPWIIDDEGIFADYNGEPIAYLVEVHGDREKPLPIDYNYEMDRNKFKYSRLQEHNANLRLIAAAPELLKACESVLTHYSGSLDYQPPYVALIRAAVAKATA